jgi:hypothetical protein
MKTLIVFLMLVGGLIAQDLPSVFYSDNGFLWADSLWNDLYVDTVGVDDTTAANQYVYAKLNYQYEWLNIAGIDTGATYTDSVIVQYATHNYAWDTDIMNYGISDTTWHFPPFMRDTTWTNVNYITGADAVTTVKVHVSDYDLIRIGLVGDGVENRVWKFKAQATLKDNKIK